MDYIAALKRYRGGALVCSAFLILLVLAVMVLPGGVAADESHGVSVFGIWVACHINVYASPFGAGTVTIEGSYQANEHGALCYASGTRITALPAAGWRFQDWHMPVQYPSGAPLPGWVSPSSPNVVTVNYDGNVNQLALGYYNGNLNFTAHFVPEMITLDIVAGNGFDWVHPAVPGVYQVAADSIVELEVTINSAYQALYEFGGWIVGGGDTLTQESVDNKTAMATHMHMDWTAFDDVGEAYWVMPQLQLKDAESTGWLKVQNEGAGKGHVSTNKGGDWWESSECELHPGQVQDIQWIADGDPVVFLRWEGENCTISNPQNWHSSAWLDSSDNGTVTAVVTDEDEQVFSVTMAVSGQGRTSPPAGTYSYLVGTRLRLHAEPSTGYQFDHWSGVNRQDSVTYADVVHVVSENTTITAYFVVGGGDDDGGDVAGGIFGRIADSLDDIGLGGSMGKMMVVVLGMAGAAYLFRKSRVLLVVGPLMILGVAIIGKWVPLWLVVLLALGAGTWVAGVVMRKVGSSE